MPVNRGMPAIAGIAALIGHASRAEILTALLADRALSATDLAEVAGVGKSTISAHLEKLLGAGLVGVERRGRHKYFRLAHPDVADALETLMGVASRTGALRVRVGPTDPVLRKARICYDHLAGEMGVLLHERLLARGLIVTKGPSRTAAAAVDLTVAGERFIRDLGIDIEAARARRRSFCHACLDWSERRHHLAGALGAALFGRIEALGWARRAKRSRGLLFSSAGEAALRRALDGR